MTNYFRITGYCPKEDFCFIVDSYGYFEKLWQLSSNFVQKGMEIVAVGSTDKFLDGNIDKMQKQDTEYMHARVTCNGRPIETTFTVEGVVYKALKVGDKIYVPDKTKTA